MTNKKIQIQSFPPLTGHQGALYTLLQPFDGLPILWSAGSDGMVAEWQPLRSPDAILRAQIAEPVMALAKKEDLLVVGTLNGAIHYIDLNTKNEIKSEIIHPKGVYALHIENEWLYSIGGKGKFTRSDLRTQRRVETLAISPKNLRCFDFHQKTCAIGSSDGNIYLLDAFSTAAKVRKTLQAAHDLSVFVVRFSPCGKYLLSGGRDAMLKIWSIADDFALFHAIPAHLSTINALQYSADGTYFATASRDKTIKIWSAHDFQLLKVIDISKNGGHLRSVNALLWLNDTTLCSASDDFTVRYFEIKTL